MPVLHNPESSYSLELEKWNRPKREGGMNADGFEAFPAMLYKAHQKTTGQVAVLDNPLAYRTDAEQIEATAFATRCQKIVKDQYEKDRATAQGWYETPEAAMAGYEREQIAMAQAAAERHATDQRMSAQAKAEATAADEATHEHVGDVPAPKKAPRTKRITTV